MANPNPSNPSNQAKASLQLGEQVLFSGAHVLQVYTSETERDQALFDLIRYGLSSGEQTYCIHARSIDGLADELLGTSDLSLAEAREAGAFVAETSREFYMKDGFFDLERICQRWHHLYADARDKGFPGLRAVAELLPELEQVGGATPLLLYESKLNEVFHASPPTRVVCQYDARAFSGSTIMATLKVHPLVLVDRKIQANPFFIPPGKLTSH